jgi:hypothetical protein
MKQSVGQERAGTSFKPRPAKPVEEASKPHAIKKKLIFHNPYRNPIKKQVDHQAVYANRQLTWQQRFNVPPKWGDDEILEDHYSQPQPSPQSLHSPQRKFPLRKQCLVFKRITQFFQQTPQQPQQPQTQA